jgi:hypothetical protein
LCSKSSTWLVCAGDQQFRHVGMTLAGALSVHW